MDEHKAMQVNVPRDRSTSLTFDDQPAYHLTVPQVIQGLETNLEKGISSVEIGARRLKFGDNTIDSAKKKNIFVLLLEHLFNPITFILYAVFIIDAINGEWIDAGIVMFVNMANAALGFVQEFKSEKSMAALQRMSAGVATVVRDGASMQVPIGEVVAGDVVLLKAGDQVPADLRVVVAQNLEIDEALLTGESVPVFKNAARIPPPEKSVSGLTVKVALGDRDNMAFRQTSVVSGAGVGIVVAVGYGTKVGVLSARLTAKQDETTPLQRRMTRFMYFVFAIAVVLAFVIFGINGWNFDKETAIYASATGIALLPEALVAVVTVTLALAVSRMAEHNAVVRKLGAVEVLGTVTDICSDKTGTLTEGKMVVKRIWPYKSEVIYHVTGGPMDATGGFGVEEDEELLHPAPLSPQASRSRRSPDASGTGRAPTVTRQSSLSGATRMRAPSYARAVVGVEQGATESDFARVQAAAHDLAMVFAMCNNTQLQIDVEDDKLVGTGNPTELALQVAAFKLGRSPFFWADLGFRKCGQWPFDSTVKCMSVGVVREISVPMAAAEAKEELTPVAEGDEARAAAEGKEEPTPRPRKECMVLLKGAPEAVLPKCVGVDVELVMSKVTHLAKQGFRVLACASGTHLDIDDVDGKRLHDYERAEVERNLKFLGLVVAFDPPRRESYAAVKACQDAGITVRMVTGDHHATAESIARRLHILEDYHGADRVITGPVLDAMRDEQIDALPELPLVIARCSPESKVRMVLALHRRNRIVAMTGDGINDAPAIKMADVGASMGIAGVDVTKAASDVVLTDDNIATLVRAVEEGRHVSCSIKKFVVHLLTGNIAEVIILMVGLAFRDDDNNPVFPMTALEILWVNLLTSTPPSIGLSLDPMDPDAMKEPPDTSGLFNAELITDFSVYGTIMAGLSFGSYLLVIFAFGNGSFGRHCNDATLGATSCALVWRARSTVFLTLNSLLLVHGYVCRDFRKSTFSFPLFNNLFLLFSVLIATAAAIVVVYIPGLASTLFQHAELTWEWAIIVIAAVVYLALAETYKYIKRTFVFPPRKRTVITEDGGRIELVVM